jgi:hypothetical protein
MRWERVEDGRAYRRYGNRSGRCGLVAFGWWWRASNWEECSRVGDLTRRNADRMRAARSSDIWFPSKLTTSPEDSDISSVFSRADGWEMWKSSSFDYFGSFPARSSAANPSAVNLSGCGYECSHKSDRYATGLEKGPLVPENSQFVARKSRNGF